MCTTGTVGVKSPATLAPTPSITAVALLPALCSSWFFPTAAAQPFACRLPAAGQRRREERGSACPGQARLRGQGTAGQEGGCCRCSPPTPTHCYRKLIRARGMWWNKSHPRNIRSFSWLWFVGVWLVLEAYFVGCLVVFFKLWTFLIGKLSWLWTV